MNLQKRYPFLTMLEDSSFSEFLETLSQDDFYATNGSVFFDFGDESGLGVGIEVVKPDDPDNHDLRVTFRNGKGDYNYYKRDKDGGKLSYIIGSGEALEIAYIFIQVALIQYRKELALAEKERLESWNNGSKAHAKTANPA